MTDHDFAASAVAARMDEVIARIDAAAARTGRDPQDVLLLLAAKLRSAEEVATAVRMVHERGRDVAVGENRAQELTKYAEPPLRELDVTRHFIGRLQTNKARDVMAFAEMIHSVDRDDIADALERRARKAELTREVLVQVNTSGEESKGGYAPILEAVGPTIERLTDSDVLKPVGLMTIGANTSNHDDVRRSLSQLRRLRDQLDIPQVQHLSMGMSGDLEIAVEEGATIVRIGSAIFGPRPT